MLLPEDPNAPDPRVHRVVANPAEYEYARLLDDQNAITLPDKAFAQSLPLPYEAKRCVATRAESDNSKAAENGFKVRPLGVKWWPGPESGRIFNDLGKLVEQRDEWGRQRHLGSTTSAKRVAYRQISTVETGLMSTVRGTFCER